MVAFILTINKQFISARLAVIALFAGLFILSACGGGGPLVVVNNTTNNLVADPCADNVFADNCLTEGEARRATALNTCRVTVQANPTATCDANIPAAAVTCFSDPFDAACDTGEYQAVLVRSPATPKLDTLMIARTQDCRTDTLTGDNLCDRAIDNTCDPAAADTGAIRALLITDDLCNDVAEYNDERVAFVDDCRGADESKKAGCTGEVALCVYTIGGDANPFAPMCGDDLYDIDRIVYCQAAMLDDNDNFNPPAGCEIEGKNIVDTYCAANLFTTTAGCSANDDFDDERVDFCTDGTNANLDRCKNLVTLTACFTNPFGTGCDTSLGDNLMTAQDNRATYCRGVAAEDLAMDTLCTGAVANFCNSGEDANPFDMICRDDDYDITRIEHCQLAMANDGDSFDPHTECGVGGANIVNVYCKANLFTTTAGCLTNNDFDGERIADCTVGTNANLDRCKNLVTLTACFTNPFGDGCDKSLGGDLMTAQNNRASYCRDLSAGDLVMDTLCTGAVANFCNNGEDANPFDMICKDDNYNITRIEHCQLAMVDDMDSFDPHMECGVGGANIVNVYCKANLFTTTAECLTNGDFDDERVDFCTDGTNVNLDRCKNQVAFTVMQRECLRNPFGTGCDTSLGDDLMTARTNRETYCRTVEALDLEANALCTGAITNFCDISEFDKLCVADIYQTERETTCRTTPSNGLCTDTIAGLCANVFIQTLEASPDNLCKGAIDGTTYEDQRDVACLANDEADGSCKGTGGLIDVFCKADPFNPADDCMAGTYNINRETLCLNEPSNGSCGGIIAEFCIANPLRQTTQATPANLCGAEYDVPREIACRAIAVAAVGTTAGCVDLVTETCTFVAAEGGEPASGNPYDALCDVADYGQDQTAFCTDSVNMMESSRCIEATKSFCDDNPFGSNSIDCDETYAPDRLTACRKDADMTEDLPSGADCTDTIAGVCSNDVFDPLCTDSQREVSCRTTPNERCRSTIRRVCEGVGGGTAAAPFDALCDADPLHADLSYTNARELVCIGVASSEPTPDMGGTDRCPGLRMSFCMNNPFDTTNGYCEHVNYNPERESMCSAGGAAFGTSDCTLTITRICDTDMGNDIFNSICDTGYTQARIDDCTSGSPTNAPACDTAEVYGTICGGDTGNDNTNPFSTLCDTATEAAGVTEASLALARQAVVTFCNDGANKNITPNCMKANNTIDTLNTDCVLVANTFDPRCDYTQYDNNRAAFCGVDGGVDSFNPACQDEYVFESETGRKKFITLCRETRDTEGCDDVSIAGSVTVADCITNPYQGECIANPDFSGEAVARTTFCGKEMNFYNDLCTVEVIDGLADRRLQYCATGAGGFSNDCQNDGDVVAGDQNVRKIFVAVCRETRDAAGCATTNIDGTPFDSENPSVTVADCITNPYRVECYGADDNNRNPDFVDETIARDTLCANPVTFFNPLCDGEVVAGVGVARAARIQLVNTCRVAEDATLLEDCKQAAAIVMEAGQNDIELTIIDCLAGTGDPYQPGCFDSTLFDDDRATRAAFCIIGDNAGNDEKCTNASMQNPCINDPFGMDAMGETCSETTYGAGQMARTTYCSEVAVNTNDPLCVSRKDFICVGTPMADMVPAVLADNPFAQLCGDPTVGTEAQTAFCMDAGNLMTVANCAADDATGQGRVCPDNPFNDSFGLNDIDCTVAAYLPQRVTQCLDGTQTDIAECDKTGIADVICAATGANANPFLALCEDVQMAGFDETNTLDSVKKAFVDKCASSNVGNLICANVRPILCLATGDFARPFATTCAGTKDIANIQKTYCGFDNTAWETSCDRMAGTDEAFRNKRIDLLAACEAGVVSQPMYCTNKIAVGLEQDLAFCVATPFAPVCKVNTVNGFLAGYRAEICNEPTTSFHADCNEADYRGTDAAQRAFAEVCERDRTATGCDAMTVGSVPIRDCVNDAMGNPYHADCVGLAGFEQQRIARALDCAAGTGTDCDAPVSGVDSTITVAGCNTDPFAAGCDSVIFANARRDNCIAAEKATAGSSHADCSVAEGQGYTNYVQGGATELELGDSVYKDADELATYMADDPLTKNIDESAVYEAGSVASDDDGNLIDDDPTTPRDESKIRVIDDPRTARDESRVYTGTTFDPQTRVLREGIVEGGLTLGAIGGHTDSGFAYAYIPGGRGANGIIGTDRYYAGLLSGTNVGTPLVDNSADGDWHGQLAIVNGYGDNVRAKTSDFVLTVNFDNKTIDSGDVAVLDGLFNIDGRFTDTGVIYGVTSFRDRASRGKELLLIDFKRQTAPGLYSRGSVTGVIGINGAVGAFISSGEGIGGHGADAKNTFGEYAGGFVARQAAPPPAESSCLHSSNLLNADCIAEDAQYYDICVTTAQINSVATAKFCTDSDVVTRYIARETACASADLSDENDDCAPVLAQLCDFNSGNIFKTDAGTGAIKFDCTKVTRYNARRVQICSTPAYRDGAVVELNGVVSRTGGIPACTGILDDACNDNPFIQEVGRHPKSLCVGGSYNMARETQCAQDIMNAVSAGAGVALNSVSVANAAPSRCFDTVIRVCADNPFNADFCYSTNVLFAEARLSACIVDPTVNATECPTILDNDCPGDCKSADFNTWVTGSAITDVAIPDGEAQNSRILQGGRRGLNTKTNVASIRVAETFLRFSPNKYKRIPTDTTVVRKTFNDDNQLVDTTITVYENVLDDAYYHGVSFFSAESASGQIGHYAGILSRTQVGALLPDLNISANWHGQLGLVSSDRNVARVIGAFILNVDFSNNRISSSNTTVSQRTISADYPTAVYNRATQRYVRGSESRDYTISDIFSLTATWDGSTGVLEGTTTLTSTFSLSFPLPPQPTSPPGDAIVEQAISTGVLTGIIGVGGAVGVFVSDETQADGRAVHYAGGFIAAPYRGVDVYAWETSFDQVSSVANTIGANAASDILLEAGIFTKTGRPADSAHFIEAGENGLGLLFNSVSSVHNYGDVPEYFLGLDGTTEAIGASAPPSSGAVFWAGSIRDNASETTAPETNVQLYAGLLPGTDVGLPLPQGAGATFQGRPSATWTGTISGIFLGDGIDTDIGEATIEKLTRDDNRLTDANFQLLIDFRAGTIKTPTGEESFGNLKLSLDGNFEGGVMAGAVALNPTEAALMGRSAGRFGGVIGTRGVVGVFKSVDDTTPNNGYIGGFVARAPQVVRFSTWTDSFDQGGRANAVGDVLLAEGDISLTGRGTNTAYFITGKANGLGVLGHALNTRSASSRFLRLDGTTGTTGDSSGIAFWGNVLSPPNTIHLYAGLLSGTDVGTVLPRGAGATFQGVPSAVWTGTIRGLFAGTPSLDLGQDDIDGFTKAHDVLTDTNFELLVNYGTGALTTPTGKESFGTIGFGLNGNFDENGVMTGDYTTTLTGQPEGRFGGIIGTTGAVGVFISTGVNVNTSIAGGFVAKPPAP
ncbi:MAG: hypothetical protein ACNYPD_01835 [Candidatus Halichondribacter symbioticus]